LEGNDRARKFYETVGCIVEPEKVKTVEREGTTLREVLYSRAIEGGPAASAQL
jgi:hypothetical protein